MYMYMKRETIWSIRKGPLWDEDESEDTLFNLKFKLHRKLSIPIPTYIQLSRLLPTKKIEPNHSFILSPNFDQVSMPYISKCHFPAYLMQVKCEIHTGM